MALFERFERWQTEDFDAFLEPKWASNRFNVERGRVRERLRSAFEQIGEGHPDLLSGLEVWVSRQDPCFFNQHSVKQLLAVVVRPMAQREVIEHADPRLSATQPDRCHAHAGLRIDAHSVELLLAVPEEAHFDLAMSEEARQGLAEFGMLLGQADVQFQGGLRVSRTFDRQEALDWPDPLAQLVEWLELAAPLLRQVLRPVEAAQPGPATAAGEHAQSAPSESRDQGGAPRSPLPPLGPAMRPSLQLGPGSRPQARLAAAFGDSPSTAAASERVTQPMAPLMSASQQPEARARQPYRPQMPAPQRPRQTPDRPDLDRILPLGAKQALQDLLQDEQQRRQPEAPPPPRDRPPLPDRRPDVRPEPRHDQRQEQRPDQRPEQRPAQARPEQRQEIRQDQRQDQRHDPRVDPRHDQRNDPRRPDVRNDGRPDPRSDPRQDPRRDQRNDPRQDQRQDYRQDPRQDLRNAQRPPQAPVQPERSNLPPIGTAVVLTGGLLAGKEGVFVAMNGPNVKVKVGVLEFEVAPHQVRVK